MPGLLRIEGTIDVSQFWPDGDADADTSKIKVTVGANAFSYAADRTTFVTTHVFDNAYGVGMSKKKVIDSKDRITVRLQGIDAPELHFKAPPLRKLDSITKAEREKYNKLNKPPRRQNLAESATVALAKKLVAIGANPLPCVVYSLVDKPFEVIDTYGRIVANINVGPQFATDLNIWLTEQGWAYPTFYSSMENEEIENLLKAMAKGRKKKKRVWPNYTKDPAVFDPQLVYRPKGKIAPDIGDVLMPKLFRRQVAHYMEKKAGVSSGTFVAFLKRKKDECHTLADFMKSGPLAAKTITLDTLFASGKFTIEPHELVFREAFSSMVDDKGKKIVDW